MSERGSNVDIITFEVGKLSMALFASCHSAVGISPFLLVRSFEPVWMRIFSTPVNYPLDRCSMAFSVVGLQSFTDFFSGNRRAILMCFPLESQRNNISLCVGLLGLLLGLWSAERSGDFGGVSGLGE